MENQPSKTISRNEPMKMRVSLHSVVHRAGRCWSGSSFSAHNLQIKCLLDCFKFEGPLRARLCWAAHKDLRHQICRPSKEKYESSNGNVLMVPTLIKAKPGVSASGEWHQDLKRNRGTPVPARHWSSCRNGLQGHGVTGQGEWL